MYTTLVTLLAAESGWDVFSRGASGGLHGPQVTVTQLVLAVLLLCAVVVAVWLGSYFVPSSDRGEAYYSPRRLFLSLCRAHNLTWRETWWLWRLARSQGLRSAARLFLEPERFDPAQLGLRLKPQAATFAQLRERLFAEPPRRASEPSLQSGAPKPESVSAAGTPLLPAGPAPSLDVPLWATAAASQPAAPEWFKEPAS